MIKIIDVIKHQNKYGYQWFLVINRKPDFIYERNGNFLIAEDSGFFNFYFYERPTPGFYAFAGRKFDIKLKNGGVEKAFGQWWDKTPPDYVELLYHFGYGTPEGLAKCNVFCSGSIDKVLVDKWLDENEPSNNYNKYNKRDPDFGKHTIDSKWDVLKEA